MVVAVKLRWVSVFSFSLCALFLRYPFICLRSFVVAPYSVCIGLLLRLWVWFYVVVYLLFCFWVGCMVY